MAINQVVMKDNHVGCCSLPKLVESSCRGRQQPSPLPEGRNCPGELERSHLKINFPNVTRNFVCYKIVANPFINYELLHLFQTRYQPKDELGEAEGRCDGCHVQEAARRGRVQLCVKVSEVMLTP